MMTDRQTDGEILFYIFIAARARVIIQLLKHTNDTNLHTHTHTNQKGTKYQSYIMFDDYGKLVW